jgi:hypothetical protein
MTEPRPHQRRSYRVVRAHEDRAGVGPETKAERADLGDLVVLVNPAIEAVEYEPFDRDLRDLRPDLAPTDMQALIDRRLPYDKHANYQKDQMPVLMVVASKGDTAVKRFLPIGQWLQGLVTFRWNRLFRPIRLVGMGRYDPFITHTLSYTGTTLKLMENPNETARLDCDCSMSYLGVSDLAAEPDDKFDLQHTGEKQTFGDGFVFDLRPERRVRGWDPNSPYFSVLTEANVISAHSDIFNSRFVGFLVAFINAYDERVALRGPKEKE